MNRRDFLRLSGFASIAAALGIRPKVLAPESDTLLGVPIEWTNFDEPETVLLGPVPESVATFKDGILYVTYATMAPDGTVEFRCMEEHAL